MTTIQTDAFPCISPCFLSAVISQCLWGGLGAAQMGWGWGRSLVLGLQSRSFANRSLNEGVWKKWEHTSPVAPHQPVVLSWAPAVPQLSSIGGMAQDLRDSPDPGVRNYICVGQDLLCFNFLPTVGFCSAFPMLFRSEWH